MFFSASALFAVQASYQGNEELRPIGHTLSALHLPVHAEPTSHQGRPVRAAAACVSASRVVSKVEDSSVKILSQIPRSNGRTLLHIWSFLRSRQCEYLLVRLLLRALLQDGNVQSELHNACGARHPHRSMSHKHLK